LKIFLVHNFYQLPGGEDTALQRERELLVAAGHEVTSYHRYNDEITRYSWSKKATLPVRTLWAWDSYSGIRRLVELSKCDVAHFHNTFPLISPAAYYACREARVPVVQSLDNPRLLCPAATFVRDHRICQDCLNKKIPWPAVFHACYRKSSIQSVVVTAMLVLHRWLKSWARLVDCFLVATEFYRRKFIEGGLPAEKIAVKPHFVNDPGTRGSIGQYALFVGRLSVEKGIDTLLDAWTRLGNIPLKIRGEGPLMPKVQEFAQRSCGSIEIVPRLDREGLSELIKKSRFLIWPSEGYYETFGFVAVEAFSCGVPVIASRVGVAEEIVKNRRTGLHFIPGKADNLAAKVAWAWAHPDEMGAMGHTARSEYEARYTAERNYEMLMEIYQRVQDARGSGGERGIANQRNTTVAL
jgi:glycosyltransferase involved in cell wall biosynthesis